MFPMDNHGDKLLIEFPEFYVAIDSLDIEAVTDNKTVATIPDNDNFIDGVIVHRGETFALANITKLIKLDSLRDRLNKIIILKNKNKQLALSAGNYPISFNSADITEELKDTTETEEFFSQRGTINNKDVRELDWKNVYDRTQVLLTPKKDIVRVLLVDDEQFFKDTIKDILKNSKYTIVGEASNGEEGVKLATELKPDLIIMDIMMPIKNGIEATMEITNLELSAQVVMCSSTTTGNAVDLAFDAGAKAFIEKPIKKQVFLEAINKVTNY